VLFTHFSTLVGTYQSAKTAERRELLHNTYSVRHILPGELRLEVRDWLDDVQADPAQDQRKILTFA